MNSANPTLLRLDMAGVLADRHYRIAGRVVLGVEEGGATYYWNEFNLVGEAGKSATLVFEETDNGPEWRLFTLFEPVHPLTAREAAAKRAGDTVNLEGTPVRIALVEQSRVYHIEGTAPEGVEVGDLADYFNAEAPNRMLVVSWTGDDIEFYHGMNLAAERVAAAFGMVRATADSSSVGAPSARSFAHWVAPIFGVALAAVMVLAVYSSCRPAGRPAGAVRMKALAAPLTVGTTGLLAGRTYTIAGHAVVEVAKVGMIFERHEYHLTTDTGEPALLVCGLNAGTREWHLFTPTQPADGLSPPAAAAKRVGDVIRVEARTLQIQELFQSSVQSRDGQLPFGMRSGVVWYGFLGHSGDLWVMARWTELGISFHAGRVLSDKEVTAAFGPKSRPLERPEGPG